MKRSSKFSNLSFRPLKVGMVVDNAFGSLGSPMFCWVTFRSDSSNLSTMWSGNFLLGGGKLDDRGGISVWGNTPATMCWPSPLVNSFASVGLEVGTKLSGRFSFASRSMTFDVRPDRESIFEDHFSIIFSISLCPASVSSTLLPMDFSILSDFSVKSLFEILGLIYVLRLDDSGSPIELVKEPLTAFLLEVFQAIQITWVS